MPKSSISGSVAATAAPDPKSTATAMVREFFDVAFYRSAYGSLPKGADPLDHFMSVGWMQGRDPAPGFSTFKYLLNYDDVLYRHLNPFVHYLLAGRAQGRRIFDHSTDQSIYLPWDPRIADLLPVWFDEDYYRTLNPDLAGAPSLLTQFLVLGWVEGRDPCEGFSTHKYLWKYADVGLAGVNPLLHYIGTGQAEGREALPVEGSRSKVPRRMSDAEWLETVRTHFDPEFYAHMYPSTADAPDLFEHYRTIGWLEGRDPSARFSNRKYLEFHKDVHGTGQEPLYHFVRFGVFEGRQAFASDGVREAPPPPRKKPGGENDELVKAEFDEVFYRTKYPELGDLKDAYAHYMSKGWREGRNPSKDFDTEFYLRREGDIRKAGINPFRHFVLHGRREGRRGISRIRKVPQQGLLPKVSVIVPNYNHAAFLPDRLRSIVAQNYANLELIILDDCSQDGSVAVIEAFCKTFEGDCKLVLNTENSGSVFSQWQKGLALATGELIWICESDDTCDANFLNEILFVFANPSVKIAFGNIQFIDADDAIQPGMDQLRESAAPGIWSEVNVMPAAKWFTGPLAVRNLIANVGGAVFRKPVLSAQTWALVKSFRVAGDWVLYLIMAGTGQIAYAPEAKAYFRQHGKNTSVTAFDQTFFYEELARFHTLLRETWALPDRITLAFYGNLLETFNASKLAAHGSLSQFASMDRLINVKKKAVHIAVSFLNFNVGGGEIFPIELLNELHRRGHAVSAVVQSLTADNDFVRNWLDPHIPVYVADLIDAPGPEFARDAGIDIVHSHNIWAEFFFFPSEAKTDFDYVATLHGSYEVSHVSKRQIDVFFDRIRWTYLADRNLEKFHAFGFDTSRFTLIPNGLARRSRPDPVTRKSLGISKKAKVFLFAARSHPEKGWLQAAAAFDALSRKSRDVVLLMSGEGGEADKVRAIYAGNDKIKMLGFRSDVDDLLGISDVLLLPTRFIGESMPLTLIQGILASVPIISTDVGQIRDMLEGDFGRVGVTIPLIEDDEAFVARLLEEMQQAAAGKLVVGAEDFAAASKRFSIETCADKYCGVYGLPTLSGLQPVAEASHAPVQDAPATPAPRSRRASRKAPVRLPAGH